MFETTKYVEVIVDTCIEGDDGAPVLLKRGAVASVVDEAEAYGYVNYRCVFRDGATCWVLDDYVRPLRPPSGTRLARIGRWLRSRLSPNRSTPVARLSQ